MIRLAVAGASGRTGRRVIELAGSDDRFVVAAGLTSPSCSDVGQSIPGADDGVKITDQLDVACDVLIDFTVASGTMAWLEVCRQRGLPMVIGATGHDADQLRRIAETAESIPIVKASNFSIGVQALRGLIEPLVRALGDGFDVEIVEAHHRHKIDAPSGTALALADEVARSTGGSRDHYVFGRDGETGERPPGQIGIHSVRMGELVGRHEIHFSGRGETVTLRHEAHSRDAFAAGALRAAAWIVHQPPGLYGAGDVRRSDAR